MSLCSTAALNAWDRIQELGKRTESYIRLKQDQREPFTDFIERLTKAIQLGVTDPEARCILIESLTFENANLECKKILGPLKVRSAPIDKFILQTMTIETFDDSTEVWEREVISNGMRDTKMPKVSIVKE